MRWWTAMDDLAVLHALSVKGFASAEAIGGYCGLGGATVAAALERLAADGHVRHRGRIDAWSLTATGRAVHRDLLAREAAAVDAGPLAASYRRFLACDQRFKKLCT